MKSSSQLINDRTEESQNQLHYFTARFYEIIEMFENNVNIYDIGMDIPDFA